MADAAQRSGRSPSLREHGGVRGRGRGVLHRGRGLMRQHADSLRVHRSGSPWLFHGAGRGGGRGAGGRGANRQLAPPPPPAPPTHLPLVHPDWQLWWLHPPKCATSFRYSVMDYPWSPMRDRSFPQGNHQVLFPDIAAARNLPKAKLVAFFRQPEDRLLDVAREP